MWRGLFLLLSGLSVCQAVPETPSPRLFEWSQGIGLESPDQDGMKMFLWFYEWNIFEAFQNDEHSHGTTQFEKSVNAGGTEATARAECIQLAVKAVPDGAVLTLTVANKTTHPWPACAGMIPCLNPGPPDGWQNPDFLNKDTYFLGPEGLVRLEKREIHFNERLKKEIDARSPARKFVFSNKWPSAGPDAAAGLIVRESNDKKWVSGVAWSDFVSVQGHNPWSCMHLSVCVGPLAPGESRTIQGKIYQFKGTKEECLEKFRKDFDVAGPLPRSPGVEAPSR